MGVVGVSVSGGALNQRTDVGFESRGTFRVAEDTSLPGFADSVARSWGAFTMLVGLGVVLVGTLVPFAWLMILAGVFWWWRHGAAVRSAGVSSDGVM